MHHNTIHVRMFGRRLPGHTVIALRGDLDIATTPILRGRILTQLRNMTTSVIIDLSGVSFCDASGLALLVGAQRCANLRGITITLAAPRPHMTKLLRITGLDRAFTVHATLASAQFGNGYADHRTVA